jgi:hypothetical protein
MPTYKESCLIELKIGDVVREKDRVFPRLGVIQEIHLVPNGNHNSDSSLIASLTVKMEDGNRVVACSRRFEPSPVTNYAEFYPSSSLWKD